MKFFQNCNTLDEVKALYKKLAKENHPDLGGDTALMQSINNEYAFACATLASGSGFTREEAAHEMQLSELYREAIEKVIHLPGIIIEVVGHWIWVTGDTKPIRGQLKAAHFFFACKKLAWYFRADAYKTKGGKKSLDEIKAKYGAERINGHARKALAD